MGYTLDSIIIGLGVLVLALIAIGGGVWELVTQKVIVDQDSKKVVQIELPGIGKFKTNYPAIGAIVVGALLAFTVVLSYDIRKEMMPVTATVKVVHEDNDERKRADVFVSMIPQQYKVSRTGVLSGESVSMKLRVNNHSNYDVMAYTPTSVRPDGSVERMLEFGPLKREVVNGREVGVFNTVLRPR